MRNLIPWVLFTIFVGCVSGFAFFTWKPLVLLFLGLLSLYCLFIYLDNNNYLKEGKKNG